MTISEQVHIFSDNLEMTEPYLVSIGDGVIIAAGVQFATHDVSACFYIPGASDLYERILSYFQGRICPGSRTEVMKKKLLFINGHLNTGGVEKSLADILKHLDFERFDVELLLLEGYGDYLEQIPTQVNVRVFDLHNTYGSFFECATRCIRLKDWGCLWVRMVFLFAKYFGKGRFKWLRRTIVGTQEYDCVIGFRPGIASELAAYSVPSKKKITWWHHGEVNVDPKSYLETALHCDKIAVVSDSCRQMLEDTFPSLTDKLIIIPNMLDVESVWSKADAFDPHFEKNLLHIVSVGRLSPEKHFENAIFAASKLKECGFVFKWHLVGDGALRDELRQKAVDLDVTDCFVFEGNQVNPYPFLKHADLFVHPSYVESFGIVVTEALALGVPCVVTKSTGVLDFLEDGKNAVLTEQSPESLTEKVIEVLENRSLREDLRRKAHCPEQFLPNAVMRKIDALLEMRI